MRLTRSALVLILSVVLGIGGSGTLSAQGALPAPEEVLGFKVGADYHLATYTQAVQYFRLLAKNSDRVKLFDMGLSSMGQTMTYAVISPPDHLARLDDYKGMMRRLSLARDLEPE